MSQSLNFLICRLSTFFIAIIAVGELFAIPIIINENVVFEVINPVIEETTTTVNTLNFEKEFVF